MGWRSGCGTSTTRRRLLCCCGTALALLGLAPALALSQQASDDLTQKSLEDLMNLQVVSASRKVQRISQVAAAIYVITQNDIRQSGAQNIPDLLRMVPGLDVAQINAYTWAISARGFNDEFSNKMQVLLDGRSVYTPTFSGVYWGVLDLPFDDIDRIEVIRGPGGTSWGANAVNGVINIITRRAGQTPGLRTSASVSTHGDEDGMVQYGGEIASGLSYRFFAKYLNRNSLPSIASQPGPDGWHLMRAGFRLDTPVAWGQLSAQGDLYIGRQTAPIMRILEGAPAPIPLNSNLLSNLGGGYLQGEWSHISVHGMETTIRTSFDGYRRTQIIKEARDTFNFEFQQHRAAGPRHDLLWNFAYRYSTSASSRVGAIAFNPADLSTHLFSGSLQDEISILPNRLTITAGLKVEHNHYTGFGAMPDLRAALRLDQRQTIWVSAARAIRTPSSMDTAPEADLGTETVDGAPVSEIYLGNPHVGDEGLIAYEAGWRKLVTASLSVNVAAYLNHYDHLHTFERLPPVLVNDPQPHWVQLTTNENNMHGEAHGVEVWAAWKPARWWTLNPAYSFERIDMSVNAASNDTVSAEDQEGSNPAHQAQLRSVIDFPHGFCWSLNGFFVSRLWEQPVPSYTRLDTILSRSIGDGLQLRLVGQNLLRDRHLEFNAPQGYANSTQMKRSGYVQLTWWF